MHPGATDTAPLEGRAAPGDGGVGTTEAGSGSVADGATGTASAVRIAAIAGLGAGIAAAALVSARPAPQPERGEKLLYRGRPRRSLLRYAFSLGTWEVMRRSTWFEVTDSRVLLARGLLVRHTRSIPLTEIVEVDATTGPFEGSVRLAERNGAGIAVLGPMRRRTAKDVAATIALAAGRRSRRAR